MTGKNVNSLITLGESQTLEFKTSFERESIETLVAFANARGGVVIVEVTDDGVVRGIILEKETLNNWLVQIKSATSPSIIPDIAASEIGGKTVVLLSIDEYPVKPVHTKGKYFKRIAASNHQLALSEITDLYMQSLQFSWDAYEAPRQSLDALSWIKIEKFIEQVNLGGHFSLDNSPLLALVKLKYIANSRPTWAALLLFAEEPLRHHILIGRFKTSAMIIDDRHITDTLFEAVEQAMKFIVFHINVAFIFNGSCNARSALPTLCLRCVRPCLMRLFTGTTPTLQTSRSKYSMIALPSSALASFLAG